MLKLSFLPFDKLIIGYQNYKGLSQNDRPRSHMKKNKLRSTPGPYYMCVSRGGVLGVLTLSSLGGSPKSVNRDRS